MRVSEIRERESWRLEIKKKKSSMKGEKKKMKKNKKKIIINGSQTVLVTKDQIVHFLKPLNMLGNTPNFRIGYCNLAVLLYVHTSHRSGLFFG